MASLSLYPPEVDYSAAAIIAEKNVEFKLYFSLSRFSTTSEETIRSIHISVTRQDSGRNVVNTSSNEEGRLRKSGIIILTNPTVHKEENNLYYVTIKSSDIKCGDTIGWSVGTIYKFQMRVSSVTTDLSIKSTAFEQNNWLKQNTNYFSEWSTYCLMKSIGRPRISIPTLKNFDTQMDLQSQNRTKEYNFLNPYINITGTYSNEADPMELLYSYSVEVYDRTDMSLLESSGDLYTNQYYNQNQFHYRVKHRFEDGEYTIRFNYSTINRFNSSLDFDIGIYSLNERLHTVQCVTLDNIDSIEDAAYRTYFKTLTSLQKEEEEGVIGIKLFADADEVGLSNGNFCIMRTDETTNFSQWTDIKMLVCLNQHINNLDIFYDKTIESGVMYKYAVSEVDVSGYRVLPNQMEIPISRDFEYAYLIGEGGRQLKLCYNNEMGNYKYTISEGSVETIGGKYPFVTTNGNLKYRTFPVNGLISYNMDENDFFTNLEELYPCTASRDAHSSKNKILSSVYDYKREYDFREKVLQFLMDGKPKLYKSATEGNIIVKLTEVDTSPLQELNRMLFSFSASAIEVDDATMDNYLKYGFYKVGDYATDFKVYQTKIGQISLSCRPGEEMISKIYDKYDLSTKNTAGNRIILEEISKVSITFGGEPTLVRNSADQLALGWSFKYNGKIFTVYALHGNTYVFDDSITFNGSDKIEILGGDTKEIYTGDPDEVPDVEFTLDFLYTISRQPWSERIVDEKTMVLGMGQWYEHCKPGSNIFQEIAYRYKYDYLNNFRLLNSLVCTSIEAPPGAKFYIKTVNDTSAMDKTEGKEFIMNETGILNFSGNARVYGITFVGMVDRIDKKYKTDAGCDILIDYIYVLEQGKYIDKIQWSSPNERLNPTNKGAK